MAEYTDPDFSDVDALPDPGSTPKLSAELESLADAIRDTTAGVSGSTKGMTPEEVTAAAAAAQQATRDAATNAAVAEEAVKILKGAAAAWRKDAPKKKDLEDADKAITDARAALAAAQKAADDAKAAGGGAGEAAANVLVTAAEKSLQDAIVHKADLVAKRTAADEKYETQRKLAAEKMKTLKGMTPQTGGNGKPVPRQSTDTGSGATGGAGSTPGKSTGSTPGATSPGSTPGKTPGTTAPGSATPETKTSGTSPSDTAALASLLSQGQQQAQSTPTATPAAQAPQQATQPQQQAKDPKNEKKDGAIDVDDLIRSGILPASAAAGGLALGLGGAPASESPSPSATPQPATTFRPAGTPIPGTALGGAPAVNAQTSPTTGTSTTGLHTSSDVSGRSAPAATAFSPTPAGAETKTSGATPGGAGGTQAAQQAATRGGMPQMPMVPPMMGGMGAPAAGSRAGGDGDRDKITTFGPNGLLHGADTLSEAVRGGTIAQNRPSGSAA